MKFFNLPWESSIRTRKQESVAGNKYHRLRVFENIKGIHIFQFLNVTDQIMGHIDAQRFIESGKLSPLILSRFTAIRWRNLYTDERQFVLQIMQLFQNGTISLNCSFNKLLQESILVPVISEPYVDKQN